MVKDSSSSTTSTSTSSIGTKVKVVYHTSKGKVTKDSKKNGYDKQFIGDKIVKNSKSYTKTYKVDSNIGKNGLLDYNNKESLEIKDTSNYVPANKEWKRKDGKTFSQTKNYSAKTLCEGMEYKKDTCTVDLYLNWTKAETASFKFIISTLAIPHSSEDIKLYDSKLFDITTDTTDGDNIRAAIAKKINWTSSDTKIATIKKGVLSTKKAGTITVTATLNDISQSINVNVYSPTPNVKRLDLKDSNKFTTVTTVDGISAAQGLTITEKYYIAAKQKNEKAIIWIYNKKNAQDFLGLKMNKKFGHANGLTYDGTNIIIAPMEQDSTKLYIIPLNYIEYLFKVKRDNIIDITNDFNVKTIDPKTYFSGISYYNGKYYRSWGGNMSVLTKEQFNKNENVVDLFIRKAFSADNNEGKKTYGAQDAGQYKNYIISARYFNSKSVKNTMKKKNKGDKVVKKYNKIRNSLDFYDASTGIYKKSIELHIYNSEGKQPSDAEVESAEYDKWDNKFVIYMQAVGNSGTADIIYTIKGKTLKEYLS